MIRFVNNSNNNNNNNNNNNSNELNVASTSQSNNNNNNNNNNNKNKLFFSCDNSNCYYLGGTYHGKLIFPSNYPFSPPSILMLTPNGRFSTNTRLCLSMSDYHPETWYE